MAFEEIFNPGAAHLQDQRNIDKLTPPSVVVAGAPVRDGEDLGVVIPDILSGYAVLPDPPSFRRDDEGASEDD